MAKTQGGDGFVSSSIPISTSTDFLPLPLDWVLFIFSGACFAFTLFIPETLASTLLKRKAQKLRKDTGDKSYRTLEELDHRTFSETLKVALFRPLVMLFTEPIVFYMTCCMYIFLLCPLAGQLTAFLRSFVHLQYTLYVCPTKS